MKGKHRLLPSIILLLFCLSFIPISRTTARNAVSSPGIDYLPYLWMTQCVDCPKQFSNLGKRSLQLDAEGHPHVAYGGNHLYYAWYDGAGWQIETVDKAPGVGGHASLALDSAGNPHISYCSSINETYTQPYHCDDLKYARRLRGSWIIYTVDKEGETGFFTSLALDSAGNPHISYIFKSQLSGDACLKFARWTESRWDVHFVNPDENVDGYTSIALDSVNHPHISYYNRTNSDLMYAQWTGNAWEIQTVDSTGAVGYSNALALDKNGNSHIGYSNTAGHLMYAKRIDGVWNIHVLDVTEPTNVDPTLVLDGEDHPHLSYYDFIHRNFKHIYLTKKGWFFQAISGAFDNIWYLSLAVDKLGSPHLLYFVIEQSSLQNTFWWNGRWELQTVDHWEDITGIPSMKLDSSDRPHFIYSSYGFSPQAIFNLKIASPTPNGWEIQKVLEGKINLHISHSLDAAGNPHFSFYDGSDQHLKYGYWTGAAWHIETVDDSVAVGVYPSISIDSSGRPHIGYYDQTNNRLKYARWTGAGWEIQVVEEQGIAGIPPSLVLDTSGRPAISYSAYFLDNNKIQLRYAQWNGSSWEMEVVDEAGGLSSLALDTAGNPHIGYQAFSQRDLKYVRWNGSAWEIQVVDSESEVSDGVSLALDNAGNPHISYVDSSRSALMYARWTGRAWVIQTVDHQGSISPFTSIAIGSTGRPYIGYVNFGNGELRYAVGTPPTSAIHFPLILTAP